MKIEKVLVKLSFLKVEQNIRSVTMTATKHLFLDLSFGKVNFNGLITQLEKVFEKIFSNFCFFFIPC